jgi:hypothetical protein
MVYLWDMSLWHKHTVLTTFPSGSHANLTSGWMPGRAFMRHRKKAWPAHAISALFALAKDAKTNIKLYPVTSLPREIKRGLYDSRILPFCLVPFFLFNIKSFPNTSTARND